MLYISIAYFKIDQKDHSKEIRIDFNKPLRLNDPTYFVPKISLIFSYDEDKGISFT